MCLNDIWNNIVDIIIDWNIDECKKSQKSLLWINRGRARAEELDEDDLELNAENWSELSYILELYWTMAFNIDIRDIAFTKIIYKSNFVSRIVNWEI